MIWCLHVAPGILLSVLIVLYVIFLWSSGSLLVVFWQFSGGHQKTAIRPPEDHLLAVLWWSPEDCQRQPEDCRRTTGRLPEDHQKNLFPPKYGKNKKHYDIREFLWKITLLHGQLCHKPYSFFAYGRFDMTKVPCTPPQNEKFWDFAKNELLWWEKIGKVVNQVKLAILSQSELLFGGKPGKSWKLTKIGHFKPIWATLVSKLAIVGHFPVGNNLRSCKSGKIWPMYPPSPKNEKFWDLAKNELLWWKNCESGEIGCSKSFWATSAGKVVNRVKLAVQSDSEQLWWDKIRKLVNWAKLAIPSNWEPFWWEKTGKVENWAKLAIKSNSELFQWEKIEKLWIGQNGPFQVILSHFGGKRLEKLQSTEIGHTESFWASSVGKDCQNRCSEKRICKK